MRSPRVFMAMSSRVVTDFGSSAIGRRARDRGSVELGKLALPERAIGELGVWNGQAGVVRHPVAKPHDVEIQGARSPAYAPLAPALRLDSVQVVEQRPGLERRLEQDHLIEVGSLGDGAEGGGLLDGGFLDESRARQRGEPRP